MQTARQVIEKNIGGNTTEARIGKLEAGVEQIRDRVANIQTGLDELRTEVREVQKVANDASASLRADVSAIKSTPAAGT